jgi:hypothetical protein
MNAGHTASDEAQLKRGRNNLFVKLADVLPICHCIICSMKKLVLAFMRILILIMKK